MFDQFTTLYLKGLFKRPAEEVLQASKYPIFIYINTILATTEKTFSIHDRLKKNQETSKNQIKVTKGTNIFKAQIDANKT